MVVFWKEDSGRQLITPENEGGDETNYPSPLSRRAVNPLLGCSSGKPVQDQLA